MLIKLMTTVKSPFEVSLRSSRPEHETEEKLLQTGILTLQLLNLDY
jgi:hypothetical protein